MRRAMADAEVGDDVYGEDPTVNRLQERVAELLGAEAALFVPSGSMANQIAIQVHCRPGDEVLAGRGAHSYLYESGAASAYGGVQITLLPGDGRFTADEAAAVWKPDDHNRPPTRLVMVENTHNMGGGLVWDRAELTRVIDTARRRGGALHLDGARLWNAAVAIGVSERELAAGFDTVSVCLSKGLGAPAGSLVCTTRERIVLCRRLRKMFGGGMRQVGILAAAGLYAVEHHRTRLAEDHANARTLAQALGVDPSRVETNIVMMEVAHPPQVVEAAAKRGVKIGTAPGGRVRMVTHLDVDRARCIDA